jgi:hypothetical protein
MADKRQQQVLCLPDRKIEVGHGKGIAFRKKVDRILSALHKSNKYQCCRGALRRQIGTNGGIHSLFAR